MRMTWVKFDGALQRIYSSKAPSSVCSQAAIGPNWYAVRQRHVAQHCVSILDPFGVTYPSPEARLITRLIAYRVVLARPTP